MVVGDLNGISPEVYGIPDNPRFLFLGIEKQYDFFPVLSAISPLNQSVRKNLGYLYAKFTGAKYIWDFEENTFGTLPEDISKNLVSSNEDRILNFLEYFKVSPV